jgi:hypothetical protein
MNAKMIARTYGKEHRLQFVCNPASFCVELQLPCHVVVLLFVPQ